MGNQTLALFASFIAMAFVVAAYCVKKKADYLLCELLCIVFLVISYFFHGTVLCDDRAFGRIF